MLEDYNRRHDVLDDGVGFEDHQESHHLIGNGIAKSCNTAPSRVLRIVISVSASINIILIIIITLLALRLQHSGTVLIPSNTGLGYESIQEFKHDTPYWNGDAATTDALWENLTTNPLVVAIPDRWASAHHLPPTGRWPWDHTRGRYFVKAFHELHCLKYIRRYVTDCQRGEDHALIPKHVMHCLDTLRQGIMCRADDTLQPSSDDSSFAIGDHQLTQCRDWGKLTEWAFDLERNACHRTLSDYGHIKHSIERFAFCPEGSPYKGVVDAWFEEHGHRDPWN